MAITVNKNTTQAGMTAAGRTGVQSIKFIPAPRVYIKAVDTSPAPCLAKSNGETPSGWTDLGSVAGAAKVTYTPKVQEVLTGIDNVFRAAYINGKTGQVEFSLAQLDDVVIEQVTGLTASVITSGSVISYQVGQTDLYQKAILLVLQNKLDGKELQFYNPNAYINFTFEDSGDAASMKVTAMLPFFVAPGNTLEGLLSVSVFA